MAISDLKYFYQGTIDITKEISAFLISFSQEDFSMYFYKPCDMIFILNPALHKVSTIQSWV